MPKKCDVLLTGSTGFIGSHLRARLLEQENIRLVCVGSSLSPYQSEREITIRASLSGLVPSLWDDLGIDRFDIVYHLAAFTPKSSANANDYEPIIDSNINGTASLLRSLIRPPKRFVFSSTLDVYAPGSGVISEETSVAPKGLYGLSKVFCERVLQVDAERRNYEFCVLRYGHVFGPGEEAYKKLIPTFIRNAICGQPLIIADDRSTQRDFLYVDDAVEATIRAGTCKLAWDSPTNIVRGESVTLGEVAEAIKRAAVSESEILFKNSSGGHSMQFRNDVMLSRLGPLAFTPFQEGIECETKWFQNKVAL